MSRVARSKDDGYRLGLKPRRRVPYTVVLLLAVGLLACAWWVSAHQPAAAAEAAVAPAAGAAPAGEARRPGASSSGPR